jgi:hypothetical protein
MRHRHIDHHEDPRNHPGERSLRPPRYAAPRDDDGLYDGLPAITDRPWGPTHEDRQTQGGQGSFSQQHQGTYGESQGRHAQSGQSRGGVAFGARERESIPSRGIRPTGYRGRGPQGYVRPDHNIADDIVSRLTDDDAIDASEILIRVDHGLVTLTGNVPERAMKRRAENLAAMANGVVDVANHIRVDDGSASFGPPGQAVRSGHDQQGSGFSSSSRPDPVYDNPTRDSNWPGY